METIEVVVQSGGDELLRLSFSAGDRPAQTEKSLRLLSWIVGGVTREETRKRATRARTDSALTDLIVTTD